MWGMYVENELISLARAEESFSIIVTNDLNSLILRGLGAISFF